MNIGVTCGNLDELYGKYLFISKNPYFNNCFSKIFLLEDRKSGEKFICKRIVNMVYKEEEWKYPLEINTSRVVTISGVYGDEEYTYIVMPFNNERDLFSYISERNFNEDEIKPIIREMAKCIKDCHDKGIAHLDIKTENFIVRRCDPLELYLIDFGFSIKPEVDNKLTKIAGTSNYYAPEINNFYCALSSDIWSLACVMYFLIIPGGGILQCNGVLNWDKKFEGKNLSFEFESLVKKMANSNPNLRYTIEDVLNSNWLK